MTLPLAAPPPPPADATLAHGEAVARALLGTDALYREESGDPTGLVVVNLDRDGRLSAEPFADYAAARARWTELGRAARALAEPDRRSYYGALADATLTFLRWREEGLPFRDRLAGFLAVPADAPSGDELDRLRHELHATLGRLGHAGDLAARAAAWEAENRVPAGEVEGVLAALLAEAWRRTEERLIRIPAPPSDGMRVRGVRGVAYNARCDYPARTVDVNVDPVLTRPALQHLAVHEGCPGHYVQFKLRETWAAEGRAAADVLLSVVNTVSSCAFEGIADAGMEMAGWIETDDDRAQALLNRYRAGLAAVAAWKVHALELPEAEVSPWLAERSLAGGEGWVANRMAFVSAPERGVLAWSYWWGEAVVAPAWRAVPEEARGAFLHYLHGRMHSNETVRGFSA